MLKFQTSCAVLAYLSCNLLNEVGLSLFRYFEVGLRVCDIVVKKFTFAISSPDEFLYFYDQVEFRDVFFLQILEVVIRRSASGSKYGYSPANWRDSNMLHSGNSNCLSNT